jgi:hypothetical protein
MAGIAFRIQDEKNFYVIRASALGNNVRFYKVVNGERGRLIGPELPVTKDVWHELRIQCKGNQIQCAFDGKDVIPPLTDNSFASGKIAFWTKSDSVSYFSDARITYKPRVPYAHAIVTDMIKKYPRLLDLKVYALDAKGEPRVIGSKNEKDVSSAGGKVEKDCIVSGQIYYGKEKQAVSVVMPLRDRNGEGMAAVRLRMETFTGQTEQNALARATPIVKQMQARLQSLDELTQ